MSDNKVVIGERRKLEKVAGILVLPMIIAVIVWIVTVLLEGGYESFEVIIFIFMILLMIGLFIFMLFILLKMPKNLIVFDKVTKQLEFRSGQTLTSQMKPKYCSIYDVDYPEFHKAENHYYVVVSTHKVSYLEIKMMDGSSYGICGLKKPKDVEKKLFDLVNKEKKIKEELGL